MLKERKNERDRSPRFDTLPSERELAPGIPDPTTTARTAAQRNAILIGGAPNGREATLVEQRAVAFARGPGDFILASVDDGRTVFHFLRVLPDQTWLRFSASGESRAMEDAREAIMEVAMSVEPRGFGPTE